MITTLVGAVFKRADDSSEPQGDDWSLYIGYEPNKGAPIAFAVICAILWIWQSYQSFFKYKWYHFGGIMFWASIVWIAGFILRLISTYHVRDVGLFIAQYVCILVGPPAFAAAEYFILGRLLCYLPYHAPLHPRRVISTFVILGVIVESLTGSGAGNSAGAGRTAEQKENGYALIKASLILQAIVEVAFIFVVFRVHRNSKKAGNVPRNVIRVCYMLYGTSTLILVRCMFRAVDAWEGVHCDYATGQHCGPVAEHEWLLWVWEVSVIVIMITMLSIWHPGRYLPSDYKIYLDPYDGVTEKVGPGIKNTQNWWVTIIDPFGIGPMIKGQDKIVPFWRDEHPVAEKQIASRFSNVPTKEVSHSDASAKV